MVSVSPPILKKTLIVKFFKTGFKTEPVKLVPSPEPVYSTVLRPGPLQPFLAFFYSVQIRDWRTQSVRLTAALDTSRSLGGGALI